MHELCVHVIDVYPRHEQKFVIQNAEADRRGECGFVGGGEGRRRVDDARVLVVRKHGEDIFVAALREHGDPVRSYFQIFRLALEGVFESEGVFVVRKVDYAQTVAARIGDVSGRDGEERVGRKKHGRGIFRRGEGSAEKQRA